MTGLGPGRKGLRLSVETHSHSVFLMRPLIQNVRCTPLTSSSLVQDVLLFEFTYYLGFPFWFQFLGPQCHFVSLVLYLSQFYSSLKLSPNRVLMYGFVPGLYVRLKQLNCRIDRTCFHRRYLFCTPFDSHFWLGFLSWDSRLCGSTRRCHPYKVYRL